MPASLEHTNAFHMARRLAHIVAPEYRVFSTDSLERNEYVLDLQAKTIEVSEKSFEFEAVSAILFCAGLIRLKGEPTLATFFGRRTSDDDNLLITSLIEQGMRADIESAKWAKEVFKSNFNVEPLAADRYIDRLIWSRSEWVDHFDP